MGFALKGGVYTYVKGQGWIPEEEDVASIVVTGPGRKQFRILNRPPRKGERWLQRTDVFERAAYDARLFSLTDYNVWKHDHPPDEIRGLKAYALVPCE